MGDSIIATCVWFWDTDGVDFWNEVWNYVDDVSVEFFWNAALNRSQSIF